ncbi:MAG TPA: type VI secretion protein IcmF/TssM N-terminal domain-containing protein [Phycisphaerae bacterium]|nr:type VI secretion protein IcmF/TssM N-terminal domain-containing protein [Phycisphaerae bacterium]
MFKKLISAFKGLPPELRMLLAMAGLGSPFGIMWVLKEHLFPGVSMFVLVMCVAAGVAVLSGIGWLCYKLFGRGGKKRAKKLEGDLARQEGGGPVSMDVRAAVKTNNEKFFNAIREMRKNLNVNVYDLPWYIVMGDSGCGKTKLVNEGGLTFSTGKPEGYQLGTLNYNWWFTEDAIFIDMAGRLCNPQDDADHKEWISFLDTVGKGRKGYPINGAIVCVSAEHLMQDSPEKHEQDANTALERLRELQTRLGVTFATTLVVTKCDKILGFMQFFDRAERDITYRNQIFGWSKPGEPEELYNPDNFKTDFNGLYSRLNELRIRRLNDDVDEHELGLAYSFPEEFREMGDPLATYIRTLFPMIKQARVVKNLIFRGVYFTSATQQGSVILKHLAERLGNDAAQNFQPLETLYPKARTLFIKDLFFRKVFKEYGLVMRNEQEKKRNQKLAQRLRFATIAIALGAIALVIVSGLKFKSLIGEARAMVMERLDEKTQQSIPPDAAVAAAMESKALATSAKLGEHRQKLIDNPAWAWMLSLFVGSDEPQEHLQTIRTTLFEVGVLKEALRRVEAKLADFELGPYENNKEHKEKADRFATALKEYIYLASFMGRPDSKPQMTEARLKNLFAILIKKDVNKVDRILDIPWTEFEKELAEYVAETQRAAHLNPAAILKGAKFSPERTIARAIETYRVYLEPWATMDEHHPDPVVKQWMEIRKACDDVRSSYQKILALATTPVDSKEDLQALKTQFEENHAKFAAAIARCGWEMKLDDKARRKTRLESLESSVKRSQKKWIEAYETFFAAYSGRRPDGSLDPEYASDAASVLEGELKAEALDLPDSTEQSPKILNAIHGFVFRESSESGEEEGLNETLRRTLIAGDLWDVEKATRVAEETSDDEESRRKMPIIPLIKEVFVAYAEILKPKHFDNEPAEKIRGVEITPDAEIVRKTLADIGTELLQLATAQGNEVERRPLDQWMARIVSQGRSVSVARKTAPTPVSISEGYRAIWGADHLEKFRNVLAVLVARGNLAMTLDAFSTALSASSGEHAWGLAELVPDFNKLQGSYYSILPPEASTLPEKSPDQPEQVAPPEHDDPFGALAPRRSKGAPPRKAPARTSTASDRIHTQNVPACATRGFLLEAFEQVGPLAALTGLDSSYYLAPKGVNPMAGLAEAVAKAKAAYLARYFDAWKAAYDGVNFTELNSVSKAKNWKNVRAELKTFRNQASSALGNATAELLEHVAWADDQWGGEDWSDDHNLLVEARNKSWSSTQFQRDIRDYPGLDRDRPWDAVGEKIQIGWAKFADTVGGYAELPDNFADSEQKPCEPIEWKLYDAQLARLLQDLVYVKSSLEAAQHCRKIADREVQGRLIALQQKSSFTQEQLPYVQGVIIDSVDPAKFEEFLRQVIVAEGLFKPLDETLEGYKVRRPFYLACTDWRQFIAPDDATAYQKPVTVNIKMDHDFKAGRHLGVDWWVNAVDRSRWPGAAPDTGPANFLSKADLELGLRGKEGGDKITMTLTSQGQTIDATWAWPPSGGSQPATISLWGEGLYKVKYPRVSIGESGEIDQLFFPAFLNQVGTPDSSRMLWRVGIAWDLKALYTKMNESQALADIEQAKKLKDADSLVGTKFEFKLERPLPQAFHTLKQLPG